ncbi:MAG: hypothetical protein CVU05_05110 [Bacteroidetes bacterium HGW-Bacteroidetes-21]|nr:MAG: hypothetical protein CVU05_05110 [Bacteroidetes bacterium HGW-Bacteroidetes-21]
MKWTSAFKLKIALPLIAMQLLLFCNVGWGQVNITPTRTDVSGFPSWTDVSVAGTTYLQLLTATSSTISPAMDFDAYDSETLDFKARTYGGANVTENTVTVWISTDNGGTWTNLGTRCPTTTTLTAMTTFDLSSYNGSQVKIKFTVAGTNNGIGIGIDDIDIKGIATTSTPTITVGSLTAFGNQCTNTTSAEKSYTVSGSNLTANISIVPPTGFEISTGTGGSFVATNPITLTQSGGNVASTTIYVRFIPTLVQAYSGNIAHTSTGATQKDVAVSGSGICTSPTISTPTSTSITATTATLGGNITALGCTNVTERGIYWSTTNGFADGAGTKVMDGTAGPYATGAFTVNVSGLSSNTVYYYKAYSLNSCGTVYTAQGTFTTLKPEPTNNATGFACGTTTSSAITFTWTDASGGQVPDKYLILCNTTGTFTDPVDGTAQADVAGSKANINQGVQTVTFSGLSSGTTYFFKIFPYTNTGTSINYKTSGTVLTGSCITTAAAASANIVITEVADASTYQASFVEIKNAGSVAQDITGWKLWENGSAVATVGSVILQPCEYLVFIRGTLAELESLYGTYVGDYYVASTSLIANGGDYFQLKDASDIVIDACGTTSTSLTAADKAYERLDANSAGTSISADWNLMANRDNATPGEDNTSVLSNDCVTCTAPTTQASGFTPSAVTSTGMTISWTRGNGTGGVIVVARAGSSVNANPTSGNTYTGNSVFGSGDEIGTGNFVVYKGTGTSVSITGLTQNINYYFSVFEYNTIDICYKSPALTGNQMTPCPNYTIPFTQGFNSTSIPSCWSEVVVANPGTLGTGITYVATSTNPTATPSEGTQFVKFNSYSATSGAEIRLVSPPITTTGLSSINLDFDWFESPEYSSYLTEGVTIQYSLNGGTTWSNVQFYQRYNSINGWKAKTCPLPAAINNQASVLIGFLFHSQYGNNCDLDDVYIYTCSEPTSNPTTLTFSNITSSTMDVTIGAIGDGTKRIIVAREGAAVSFTPTDLTTYDANSVFTDATDLGSGNKVVFNGNGSTVSLSGLSGSTTYYFKVFEYNCITGNENYYTGGTILNGNATTLLSPVTNLQVTCQTNTTADISWTAPIGSYTGVIIGIRNDNNPCHAISNDASLYTANPAFGSGTQYGSTAPYSFAVYKGTGTSVTVTGLTAGQTYQIKAYAYKNNTGSVWSATQPTTAITSLGTANVTGTYVLTGNTQLQLQWSNPPSACYDEVMIVGTASGFPITTVPTGDGSAYTANLAFGSGSAYGTGYVVYKGTFSPQIVTGLTNGTEYCFTWFVRNGTTWSSGVSGCGTPATVTSLEPGDLAIVAVNTQATSSGSADEICFFAFKDITVGTSIDFTDNGYERLYADKWASSEGTIRMTRTGGGTITAGKVICFQGMGYLQSGFNVFTCGVADDANWTITSLNAVGATNGSYDLNVDDQIWIMQGGAWDNAGSLSTHNATYSGNVLYGWTATGWKPAPGYDNTKGSTLYPETECFNTNVAVASDHDKVKYIGDITTTSQFNWLGRINDNANWMGYAENSDYYAGRDYTGTCFEFISNAAISGVAGVWTGNDNEDWFDCGNWQNLRIPRGTANVVAAGAVGNHITIDDGIASMPEAECNNLTIAADATVGGATIKLKVNHANSVLNVYGNFENNQIVEHTNGTIHYKGNFVNNDTYSHTVAGIAIFDGSSLQTLTGTAAFFNMQLNNSSTGLTISNNITVNNILTLTDGLINTGTNRVIIENNAVGSVTGQSTDSYVNGNLRRKVAATGSYNLPVGTASYYELANINLTTSTITYLDAKFTSPHAGTTLPTTPYLTLDGTNLTELLDYGFWTITPVAGTATNYDVTVTSRGHTNGGSLATQHTIVKRADGASPWNSFAANHDNATQSGTGVNPITAKLTAMNGFSDFAIARSLVAIPLPVELVFFKAKSESDNVVLEWITTSEINNDYFDVERSSNGVDFATIGSVNGAGNSSNMNSYVFADDSPLNGLSYYRLKQVDFDGKFVFSNIESIMRNSEASLSVFNLYNPDFAATIMINNPNKGVLYVRLSDMSGKTIHLEKLNAEEDHFTLHFDKGSIRSGMYTITVYNNYESVAQKIVVF